jgi:hypothetical protein
VVSGLSKIAAEHFTGDRAISAFQGRIREAMKNENPPAD